MLRFGENICTVLVGSLWDGAKDALGIWADWENLCTSKFKGSMGFKNYEIFNLALLAKQRLRLMHDSSSLFFRVFKAKYFPHSTFLQASLGNNLSYIWRSIFAAKNILSKGYIWKVGQGD